jgi:SynChlorMet cassette radical SAM/SPASM protein ScmF
MDAATSSREGQTAPGEAPSLNRLYVYVTDGCNLACRHCWITPRFDPERKRSTFLRVEHLERAIQEARPLGLTGVKLCGGEPLLHPRFLDMLEIIRRERLHVTVETNGLLCTPEIAAAISRCERRFVSVSIDGADAATHEWVRGVPGAFEGARAAVSSLAAAGVAPQIIMTLMRRNADQLEAFVAMAGELGASSVKFNMLQPTARGEKLSESEEALSVAELIDLGHWVVRDLADRARLTLYYDFPMAFRPLSYIASGEGDAACGIFGILGVLASGHYALCGIGETVPELVFGQVGEDPLEEVWRGAPILQALRSGLPARQQGVCARCLMNHRCLGSCVAQNYYRTGSLWAPFWFCEEAERASLFPTSRQGRPAAAQIHG